MVQVESIFKIIFWAVPAFMRVLPVIASGPVKASMAIFAWELISLLLVQLMAIVKAFMLLAKSNPPIT